MRFTLISILIAGLLVFTELTLGHGTEGHAEDKQTVEQSPAASSDPSTVSDNQPGEALRSSADGYSNGLNESVNQTEKAQSEANKSVTIAKPDSTSRLGQATEDFTFEDFPTLHPMVVHVPVVMIPLAFLFGLISIFFANRYVVALALVFAVAGLLGGYIAAFPMHPHTQGLSEAAIRTLQQHDFFAYSTLGITASSVVVGVIAMLKPTKLAKGLLAVVLLIASLCVSITAHYGGTLTYIHGVGVKGNYLDTH